MAGSLSVAILDESATPVAARVYLLNSQNQAMFPNDSPRYDKVRPDGVAERHFIARGGRFMLDAPAGVYQLVVERGKEYLPAHREIMIPESGAATHTVRLRRWVNMAEQGWFSGDMHVHRRLADLAVLMEAEDLAAAIPITRWRTTNQINEDPDLARFLAAADQDGFVAAGEKRFFPVLNQELEPRGSALLGSRLRLKPAALDYPLASFGKLVREANGVSDSEKATSLELPALAALGACQTVGLANNHLWRSGSYADAWGAWPGNMLAKYPQTCGGFVRAGFDMYSALLNAGFPLKLSAGSASGVHPVPPGWSRVYVHTRGPLTPRAWFDRLLGGHSFVTTGPMLLLEVNGQEPGDELRGLKFPARLHVTVRMLSIEPLTQAEVVVNGLVHTVKLSPVRGQIHSFRGSLALTAATSAWITARWTSSRGNTCDVAHTSPVYIWNGDAPIPINRAEIEALRERVDRLIGRVANGADSAGLIWTDSEGVRQRTLEYFREARRVYQDKLEEHAKLRD